jgi:arginine exporter protein ArgO
LMTRESFTRTQSNARILIFLIIADVVFTVGVVFGVKSMRTKDRRLSWRLLGWAGIAFAVGFGLLFFETATASKY